MSGPLMSRPFEGKVAFITGVSSGIGAAAALIFAERGAKIAAVASASTICFAHASARSLFSIETPLMVAVPAFTRSAQRTEAGSVSIIFRVMPGLSCRPPPPCAMAPRP